MRAALLLLTVAACTTTAADRPDATPLPPDAGGQADGKDASCADEFGDALTSAFGRIDGTVVAIVEPGNERCTAPNSDHVVVQVEVDDAVYRMVVNVQSDSGDPEIRVLDTDAALPSPAFAEGWHPGLTLDYVTDLGVHSTDAWDSLALAEAAAWVASDIEVGTPISVYASSSGGTYAGSAHLIHRNGDGDDGAIVLDPTGATPRWLLFRFSDQTF